MKKFVILLFVAMAAYQQKRRFMLVEQWLYGTMTTLTQQLLR